MTAPLICVGIFDPMAVKERAAHIKHEECIGWRHLFAPTQVPVCMRRSDLQLKVTGIDHRIECRDEPVTLDLFHGSNSYAPIWREVLLNRQLQGMPAIVWRDE